MGLLGVGHGGTDNDAVPTARRIPNTKVLAFGCLRTPIELSMTCNTTSIQTSMLTISIEPDMGSS
jgi:hypothetical protein